MVILGAHWDTLSVTDGFNDNGSGMAAVLEVATTLAGSDCEFDNSIIFVAFDLEETGMQVRDRFRMKCALIELIPCTNPF